MLTIKFSGKGPTPLELEPEDGRQALKMSLKTATFKWVDQEPYPEGINSIKEWKEQGGTVSTSQQEMEVWLWDAATILRGPVDPANLRDFVFPLLFLKRLSDMWDEEHIQARTSLGEHFTEEAASDFHTFQIPQGCHWSDLRRAAENQGIALQSILQKIEQANPDRLAQIFWKRILGGPRENAA